MNKGILFTDSLRLADKYSCQVGRICNILDKFVSDSLSVGIQWELLDLGKGAYDYFFERFSGWRTYLDILDDYSYGTGIHSGDSTALFIIGGDDVIPMPSVVNDASYGKRGRESEWYLEADYLYCFEGKDVDVDENDRVDISVITKADPRFCVGRLPLEDGFVPTSPESDLGGYFSRSVEELRQNRCNGLRIKSSLMTSCQNTIRTAREVSYGIPSVPLKCDEYVKDGIVLSPTMDLASSSATFWDSLPNADLLLFILHGGPSKGHPYYSGSDGRSFTRAFDIECLKQSNARIINAVCCWGARYVGYDRKDSLLLSSIYDKVLLFTGSCRSVYGRFSNQFSSILPIGFGETFLKYYTNYLLQGECAGFAMMKAKKEYFSSFAVPDRTERAFGTIMMFNLFGNPLLRVDPIIKRGPVSLTGGVSGGLPVNVLTNLPRTSVKSLPTIRTKGIIDDVRLAVDSSLNKIHQVINQFVYSQWGMQEADLKSIETFSYRDSDGYIFSYSKEIDYMRTAVSIETDMNGRITDIVHEY